MKLLQEMIKIAEGKLRANWTIHRIQELKPRQLAVLTKNATDAGDQEVLDMINQITRDREEVQKAAAEKNRANAARSRGHQFGDVTLSKEDLGTVARKIEAVVGDTFPDGDPIDSLGPWVRRQFRVKDWDVGDVLNKAAKLHLGSKDYVDYLAKLWDDYSEYADTNGQTRNPWRSN